MKQLARWISILAHPFVITLVVVLAAAPERCAAWAAKSAALVGLVAIVPVGLLIALQVRRGRWRDVDASRREERPLLLAVGCIALGALMVWLLIRDPRSFLLRGTLAVLAMLLVSSIVNRWVKVSLHCAFAAFGAAVLLAGGSPLGWLLAALLPILAWARLAMGRHRVAEVVAGVIIGAVAGALPHLV